MPKAHTPPTPIEDRHLVTVREAAELLSVSPSTAYRLIRDGEISVMRVGQSGRGIRVTTASVRDYVARNQRTLA